MGPPAGAALAPAGWRRRPGLPAALPEAGAEAFRVHGRLPLRETQKGKSEPGWGLEPPGPKKTKTTNFGFAMCWRGPASVSLLVVPGMQFRRRRLGKKRNVCIDQDIEPPNLGFAICSAARDWRRVLVSPPVRVHGVAGPEMNRWKDFFFFDSMPVTSLEREVYPTAQPIAT